MKLLILIGYLIDLIMDTIFTTIKFVITPVGAFFTVCGILTFLITRA